jgi:hypothetical protein
MSRWKSLTVKGSAQNGTLGRDGGIEPNASGPGPGPGPVSRRDAKGAGHGSGKRRGRGEQRMVPDVSFTSYYGRPVVKESPWAADIPAYLFLGGVAAGSSLLAAGADLTGRPSLRRGGRLGALIGIGISFVALIHDLGRPLRFVNMPKVR